MFIAVQHFKHMSGAYPPMLNFDAQSFQLFTLRVNYMYGGDSSQENTNG